MGAMALKQMDLNRLQQRMAAMSAKPESRSDGLFPCCKAMQGIKAGRPADLETPDRRGKTPLQYACFMGHDECIEALASAGVDPNAQNANGMTCLHFAAMSMFAGPAVACVTKLTQMGADPLIANAAGKRPLDCVKDHALRQKLQGVMGVAVHEYKGRKTKLEREEDGDPNTSDEDDEEDDEELDDDDSEWDEWSWEWDEEEEEEEAEYEEPTPYVHTNKPKSVAEVRVEVTS